MKRKVTIERTQLASDEFGVVSVRTEAGHGDHMRAPCAQCPWRKDVPTGVFPAEAYRISAHTAEDAALSTFACHMSGAGSPRTCAGFLLRNSVHNLQVRIQLAQGRLDLRKVEDGGLPLYASYREMAIANGVPPDDPAIARCRADDE